MTSEQLLKIAEETIKQYLSIANEKYNLKMKMPRISLKLRGRTAGMAYFRENLIKLNEILFKENVEDFKKRTIPHELAHLIAHQKSDTWNRRIKPHGVEWQNVMYAFGVEATRCHRYDVANAQQSTRKLYKYTCNCQGDNRIHMVSSTVVRRMTRGARYWCKRCNGDLIRA
jgi:SprT protein